MSILTGQSTLLGRYEDYCSVVHEFIDAIPGENLFKRALRDPDPPSTSGRSGGFRCSVMPPTRCCRSSARAETWPSRTAPCSAAATDVAEALARHQATRKNRANTVQIVSRQKAEVLMASPIKTTSRSVAPATRPIATRPPFRFRARKRP
jgi:hypothetical protein